MPSAPLPTSRHFVTQLLKSLPSEVTSTTEANPLSAVSEAAKKQLLSLQVLFPNEFLPALDLLDRRLVTRLHIGDNQEQPGTGASHEAVQSEEAEEAGEAQPADEPMGTEVNNDTHSPTFPPAAEATATTPVAPNISEDTIMTDTTLPSLPNPALTTRDCVYYVRSAQQRSSRYTSSYDTTTSYEVRLQAWNCSCPAFAFAAYPAMYPEPDVPQYDPRGDASGEQDTARSGESQDGLGIFGGASLGEGMPPVCKHLLACVLAERVEGLFGGFIEERNVSVEEAAGWAAGWGD